MGKLGNAATGRHYEYVRPDDLRPAIDVATPILEKALPFHNDPEQFEQFHGTMGVNVTEVASLGTWNGSLVFGALTYDQPSGSYKYRGAAAANLLAPPETHMDVTYSTGNHGLAVALSALRLDRKAVIHVPESISEAKLTPLKQTDAELCYHKDFMTAQLAATSFRGTPGVEVIDPFGHENVLAGQSTLGLELVDWIVENGLAHQKGTIVAPMAGGGHVAGIAMPVWAAKQEGVLGPDIEVMAVQPNNTDAAKRGLLKLSAGRAAVKLFRNGEFDADCDALAIGETSLSALTLSIVSDPDFVKSIETVDKLSTAMARQSMSDHFRQQLEPAAALSAAYAMSQPSHEGFFLLSLSGRNVSPETQALYDNIVIEHNVARYRQSSSQGRSGQSFSVDKTPAQTNAIPRNNLQSNRHSQRRRVY